MNVALCTDGDRSQEGREASAQRAGGGTRPVGVQLQQLDELRRGGEGVGGDAAVVQVQRGAGDAVDLGDQRGPRERRAVVEHRQVEQGPRVRITGVAYDDRVDVGAGRDHAGSLTWYVFNDTNSPNVRSSAQMTFRRGRDKVR